MIDIEKLEEVIRQVNSDAKLAGETDEYLYRRLNQIKYKLMNCRDELYRTIVKNGKE